jgi:hypothetical protein
MNKDLSLKVVGYPLGVIAVQQGGDLRMMKLNKPRRGGLLVEINKKKNSRKLRRSGL